MNYGAVILWLVLLVCEPLSKTDIYKIAWQMATDECETGTTWKKKVWVELRRVLEDDHPGGYDFNECVQITINRICELTKSGKFYKPCDHPFDSALYLTFTYKNKCRVEKIIIPSKVNSSIKY